MPGDTTHAHRKTLGGERERTSMHTYSAYGLTIGSPIELPELPPVSGTPDVVFERAALDPVPASVEGMGGRRIQAEPGRCRLSYDSYGTFLVDGGERVLFDPESAAVLEMKAIRRLLENEMLGVLLHQRGRLVLHASAVSLEGRAVLFLGPRGAGKSTTAAAFHALGHPILEDDIVSVRLVDGTPVVDPGVPEMRLEPDAVDALAVSETASYDDDGGSNKRYRRFEEVPDPAPLAGCFLLQTGDALSIDAMAQRDQLFDLVAQTYTQGLLPDTDRTDDHFQQCATVAQTAPCYRLTRPDDHDALPRLVERVTDCLD